MEGDRFDEKARDWVAVAGLLAIRLCQYIRGQKRYDYFLGWRLDCAQNFSGRLASLAIGDDVEADLLPLRSVSMPARSTALI